MMYMGYRLDGQGLREHNPTSAQEIADYHKNIREGYYGFSYSKNSTHPDLSIKNKLASYDTNGERKHVGKTAGGLSDEQENKFTQYQQFYTTGITFNKDGNPRNDRYSVSMSAISRPAEVILNSNNIAKQLKLKGGKELHFNKNIVGGNNPEIAKAVNEASNVERQGLPAPLEAEAEPQKMAEKPMMKEKEMIQEEQHDKPAPKPQPKKRPIPKKQLEEEQVDDSGLRVKEEPKKETKLKEEPKKETKLKEPEKDREGKFNLKNLTQEAPANAPPAIRKLIEEWGDAEIKKIRICRVPIQSAITKVGNILSLGTLEKQKKKLGYEDFFHLFLEMYIVKPDGKKNIVLIEKNQKAGVMLERPGALKAGSQCLNVPVNKEVTIGELFHNAEQGVGEKALWLYDVRDNNCQKFAVDLLFHSKLLTREAKSFAIQDAKALLPSFLGKVTKGVTNLAAKLQTFFQGAGL